MENETKKKRGRPATGRTAAARKRDQRAAAKAGRATTEAIVKAIAYEFGFAIMTYCNGLDERPLTVMQLLDKVAERFPDGAERRKVYATFLPAAAPDDPDGLCVALPARR